MKVPLTEEQAMRSLPFARCALAMHRFPRTPRASAPHCTPPNPEPYSKHRVHCPQISPQNYITTSSYGTWSLYGGTRYGALLVAISLLDTESP